MTQTFRLAGLLAALVGVGLLSACHKSTDDALSSSNASANTNKPYVVDESASATKNQFDTGTPVIPPTPSASNSASAGADALGTKP